MAFTVITAGHQFDDVIWERPTAVEIKVVNDLEPRLSRLYHVVTGILAAFVIITASKNPSFMCFFRCAKEKVMSTHKSGHDTHGKFVKSWICVESRK